MSVKGWFGVLAVLHASYGGYSLPSYVQCPSMENTVQTTFFPDVCNCSQYYMCDNGVAHHMSCPPCLYFNPLNNVCDWTWNVDCQETVCPPDDCTSLPNPNDCRFYYECSGGELACKECPSGLYFNSDLRTCDVAANAGCAREDFSARAYVATCPSAIAPTCPPDGSAYFAHPHDTHWYYQCQDGVAWCKLCSPNEKWNPDTQRCEW
ncbi:peritrophin-1-like [Periplaneta americana]|uniref:peritrophin-1-like n=1 Tax=Periplaneta americana TaxID=6978 RepID=UPI0037E7AC69